jgi:hypothetical protein
VVLGHCCHLLLVFVVGACRQHDVMCVVIVMCHCLLVAHISPP